jgi:hypothetical protein
MTQPLPARGATDWYAWAQDVHERAGGGGLTAEQIAADPTVRAAFQSPSSIAQDVARRLTGVKLVVTFRHDDVQRPALDYLPVYDDFGVKASWYQVVDYLDTEGWLTTAELLAIHAAGHEIGSHTLDHRYFTADAPDETERRRQLADSKTALEQIIGGDYLCETFAFPGNQDPNQYEVLDYYIGAVTAGVAQSMRGPANLAAYQHGYYYDLVDAASLAATTTKTQTQVAAWKAVPGGTVVGIQAHNTTEMSAAQLGAILDVLTADPEVAILTQREWFHFVREYFVTDEGREFYLGDGGGRGSKRWNSASAASSGYAADRLGNGVAFRAQVAGVNVASLDDRLVMLDGSKISQFERGHTTRWYNADNGDYAQFQVGGSELVVGGTATTRWTKTAWFQGAVRHDRVSQTLNADGSLTMDAEAGDIHMLTLNANATSSSITGTNRTQGQRLTVCWIQDATGGRTYTWPTTCRFAGGSAPVDTTPGTRTLVTFANLDGVRWYEVSRAVAVPN